MSLHRYVVELRVLEGARAPSVPPEEWTVADLAHYVTVGVAEVVAIVEYKCLEREEQ